MARRSSDEQMPPELVELLDMDPFLCQDDYWNLQSGWNMGKIFADLGNGLQGKLEAAVALETAELGASEGTLETAEVLAADRVIVDPYGGDTVERIEVSLAEAAADGTNSAPAASVSDGAAAATSSEQATVTAADDASASDTSQDAECDRQDDDISDGCSADYGDEVAEEEDGGPDESDAVPGADGSSAAADAAVDTSASSAAAAADATDAPAADSTDAPTAGAATEAATASSGSSTKCNDVICIDDEDDEETPGSRHGHSRPVHPPPKARPRKLDESLRFTPSKEQAKEERPSRPAPDFMSFNSPASSSTECAAALYARHRGQKRPWRSEADSAAPERPTPPWLRGRVGLSSPGKPVKRGGSAVLTSRAAAESKKRDQDAAADPKAVAASRGRAPTPERAEASATSATSSTEESAWQHGHHQREAAMLASLRGALETGEGRAKPTLGSSGAEGPSEKQPPVKRRRLASAQDSSEMRDAAWDHPYPHAQRIRKKSSAASNEHAGAGAKVMPEASTAEERPRKPPLLAPEVPKPPAPLQVPKPPAPPSAQRAAQQKAPSALPVDLTHEVRGSTASAAKPRAETAHTGLMPPPPKAPRVHQKASQPSQAARSPEKGQAQVTHAKLSMAESLGRRPKAPSLNSSTTKEGNTVETRRVEHGPRPPDTPPPPGLYNSEEESPKPDWRRHSASSNRTLAPKGSTHFHTTWPASKAGAKQVIKPSSKASGKAGGHGSIKPTAKAKASATATIKPTTQGHESSAGEEGPCDNEGRAFDLECVVVNFANVGCNYGENVLRRRQSGVPLFDYEGVRRCVTYLSQKLGYRVVGVVFENKHCTDGDREVWDVPEDIVAMCEVVERTPRLSGELHRSADDEMTIKEAWERNCRFLDNDNYRDWKERMHDKHVRQWLVHCQDVLQMRFYFNSSAGQFKTLDGNVDPVMLASRIPRTS